MQLSAEVVAKVVIYGVVAISLAYFCSLMWLYGQMTALAKFRPDTKALEPDRTLATNRAFILVLAWWSWTPAHRDIGDRSINRGVVVSRVLCLAAVVAWAALFLSPRDFGERAEAWSKGESYIQHTN